MVNPSEKGMRDKLLLEMGECIDKLIEDPYDDAYESELLSIDDVYKHVLLLGFTKIGNNKALEYGTMHVSVVDGDDNDWTIYGGGPRGGVSFSMDEKDEYEDNDEYDEYDEETELSKEELGDLPD